MKKLEFRNGIYTVLRPLYNVCNLFRLASYSYVADGRNKRVTTDNEYLNYVINVMWLIVYNVGIPVQILTLRVDDFDSQLLFITFILYTISLCTSSIVAVVWVSVNIRKIF
jgi:hypothetical protein